MVVQVSVVFRETEVHLSVLVSDSKIQVVSPVEVTAFPVHVSDGGQAVIAGSMKAGKRGSQGGEG